MSWLCHQWLPLLEEAVEEGAGEGGNFLRDDTMELGLAEANLQITHLPSPFYEVTR